MVILMKNELIRLIESNMGHYLNEIQLAQLNECLKSILNEFEVFKKDNILSVDESKEIGNCWCLFFQPNKLRDVLKKPLIIMGTQFSR